MDLNSSRRRQSLSMSTVQQLMALPGVKDKRIGLFSSMRATEILAIFLVVLPVLLLLLMFFRHEPYDQVTGFEEARHIEAISQPDLTLIEDPKGNEASLREQKEDAASLEDHKRNATSGSVEISQPDNKSVDRLLGGLLADGFNEDSCLSRYHSVLYRKLSSHKPSSYLLSRLRNYEDLHKRCGPFTQPYKKAVEKLKSSHAIIGSGDCKYVVWMLFSGLGNRIVTIASAFLYALLTDRILLVEGGEQMSDLFCEPFPETSWLLPFDFPITGQFNSFDQNSAHCYGNMLKKKIIKASTESRSSSYLYLHLAHDYGDHDKMFFCDENQAFLAKVPWLIMKTNNYFVPSLFLIPSFEDELNKLFPDKRTVFHHLGRYLFHPSNHVWGLITRYYQAYLARADERIGIQVRVFDGRSDIVPLVTRQIFACTQSWKLLPEVDEKGSVLPASRKQKTKAILVTSLSSRYFENLKSMYWEHPTVTGEVIGVYQPSHEEHQQTEKRLHNRKAWTEIYLLSLSDALVTSAWSTFGYVAQGLGGLKPWILFKQENQTIPDPPCGLASSMEPCFHAPPFYDCKTKRGIDTGNVVPHVRHCEDISWGLKLVDES